MKNLKQKLNAKNVRAIINRPNGITLIALVITIVVLLILASVAINITVGENGIFNRAIQAKEQFEMAAVKEKLNLAILEVQTGEAIAGDDLTLDMMLTSLQEKLPGVEITKDGETLKGTLDGYDFVIDSDFKVTIEGYNEEAGNGGSEDEEEDVPTPPQVTTYTVTVSGSNVTSSGASSVEENTSYTTTLTAAEGYKIATVEVKMGDTTLTQGSHYTYEDGCITIASVTGNVEINVTAITLLADGSWNSTKSVNSPKLMDGMRGVYWTESGEKVYVTAENQNNWYNYSNKEWANAETADGSLWVWIPRYEYKIENQTITVKFIPTTTKEVETGYTYIHPAFQDGSDSGYKNGEWDEEIDGFWVAKFAAGYAGGGNSVTTVDSGLTYSGTYNSISNYYGSITSGTTMKYPVFMGQTYAYNYINIGDSYKLAKNLTKTGNPYGLNSSNTNSHQMKNSEWGAVAYLTHSQYGLDGQNLLNINNVNLNNAVSTIYAVTGYAGEGTNTAENKFTSAPTLGESITNGTYTSYAWNTDDGKKASSTQNITGVYDLSGCVWERVSAYIENTSGASNRSAYGGSLITETEQKYKTIYPHNSSSDSDENNYDTYKNAKTTTYGDGVLETSTKGSGSNSWNGDYSYFPHSGDPFFIRGGRYDGGAGAGEFAFNGTTGSPSSYNGFRAVLVAE